MRYTIWVDHVFRGLAAKASPLSGGVGLPPIGEALSVGTLSDADFASGEGAGSALMTAMYDLDAMGLVEFKNVHYGNALTSLGREARDTGIEALWDDLHAIRLSGLERTFLAQLCLASQVEETSYADLRFVDADPICDDIGVGENEPAETVVRRVEFWGDLERKGLVRPHSRALGAPNLYRPTYAAIVLVSEPYPRDDARRAGVIDWSTPTPGFEGIEARLADLKLRLAAARTKDDMEDIGRRCRALAPDAIDLVFRPEMVPADEPEPSRQDAKGRLALYLTARLPGHDHEALRGFLKAALELANADTHAGSGIAAVAAAQGLVSFVRTLEAIERATVGHAPDQP